MAQHSPTYRQRWADLVTGSHTPRQWAVIVDAIRTADTAEHNRLGEPIVRGGEDWCRLAIVALEKPPTANGTDQLPDRLNNRCLVESSLLRGWLNAPAAHGDDTVADRLDLVGWARGDRELMQLSLHRLLNASQDAGLFGMVRHRLELYRVADIDAGLDAHLLIARPDVGAGLATPLLIDGLLPSPGLDDIEAAIVAFHNVASAMNATLDAHEAASDVTARPRSFPSPSAGSAPTTRDRSAEPGPTPPSTRRRSR
jgi:hypothetical protein